MVAPNTTAIQVLEYDASGVPLAGYVIIDLDAPIGNSVEGSSWLPTPGKVLLVNGAATLNLLPSTDTNTNYHFQLWQYNPAPATDATLVYEFSAAVPLSPTPIQLRTLLEQTSIVQDNTDASIAAVVRELYYSEYFWTTLKQRFYPQKGTWNSVAVYSYGDVVEYQGNLYSSISVVPQAGQNPLTTTGVWTLFTSQGIPGTGITGDTAAYDATGWNDSVLGLKAPNKKVLRNIIEQLARTSQLSTYAPLTGATLVAPTVSVAPTTSDRSSLIPTTNWVQNILDVVRTAVNPIGLVSPYAGSSAPQYWILCDGRTVSTTTYSALYAILSTTYNIGGEAAGTFRLPDLRGRVPVGLDSMSGVMGAAGVATAVASLGSKGGAATHTLQSSEMPAHTHGVTGYNATANAATGAVAFGWNISTGTVATTSSTGGGGAHNNLQPYNGLNYIIYAGV